MTYTVIGIDPGTACGWAVLRDGRRLASGTWDLGARRHEGGGMRFVRLRRHLVELLDGYLADVGVGSVLVAYEEVRRHLGVDAAHVYGGIVAVLSEVCELREVPYQGVPVGTVKKHATGNGQAGKPAMVAAAVERWGPVGSDNEADALWIAAVLDAELATPGQSA